MARDALFQVRMDPEMKKEAEQVFQGMGLTFSEAVRLFAAQAVVDQRLPFIPTTQRKHGNGSAFGMLHIFASPARRENERGSWIASLSAKASQYEHRFD